VQLSAFFIASIIFQMGSFGFIPAFIIACGSYWIVKKIAQSFLKEESDPTGNRTPIIRMKTCCPNH
jgi:hypothetical protein